MPGNGPGTGDVEGIKASCTPAGAWGGGRRLASRQANITVRCNMCYEGDGPFTEGAQEKRFQFLSEEVRQGSLEEAG